MSTDKTVSRNVAQRGKDYLVATSEFLQAYRRFCDDEVKPCSDDAGWMLLTSFRRQVQDFCINLGSPRQGMSRAIRAFFQLACSGEAEFDFDDAAAFVKWYGILKKEVVASIGHLFEFHDDSFDCLVDGLPLAGREITERALASRWRTKMQPRPRFAFADDIHSAVLNGVGMPWHKLITEHETNIATSLRIACRRFYLRQVLNGKNEHVSWGTIERTSLDFRCEDYD